MFVGISIFFYSYMCMHACVFACFVFQLGWSVMEPDWRLCQSGPWWRHQWVSKCRRNLSLTELNIVYHHSNQYINECWNVERIVICWKLKIRCLPSSIYYIYFRWDFIYSLASSWSFKGFVWNWKYVVYHHQSIIYICKKVTLAF